VAGNGRRQFFSFYIRCFKDDYSGFEERVSGGRNQDPLSVPLENFRSILVSLDNFLANVGRWVGRHADGYIVK
jgi:hypothetical protein